ncbi:nucleoside triphosphate pyrophosphatase [Methylobacter sp.]|uniref:Maf family protein n=1 Tax=Methylobacter sp. TaxID=2051955 RepID=UPI00248A2645|nr:Maf family protein [Methylobacter sp.]MDI1276285.1 Maf family protein [Methylobacter sp.]MDI1357003.1 Maf family protein [Methylobacter sp.]
MTAQIILASASPRRQGLLDQIKVTYRVNPVDLDETPLPNETPLDYVQRLAAEKSAACLAQLDDSLPVLAADTAVVLGDLIMGKPKDREDALAMLRQLSGKMHRVYSAISLRGREHGQAVSITEVTFRALTECEIAAYWQSGEPVDKAGSYAIQGMGGVFVESISGSFSGVVGLPLFETADLLSRQGIEFFK